MTWRPWKWFRRNDSTQLTDAKARLDKAHADDRVVNNLLARRERIVRENGLARDIEAALRARRT